MVRISLGVSAHSRSRVKNLYRVHFLNDSQALRLGNREGSAALDERWSNRQPPRLLDALTCHRVSAATYGPTTSASPVPAGACPEPSWATSALVDLHYLPNGGGEQDFRTANDAGVRQ